VLQILENLQGFGDQVMGFLALQVANHSHAARIVFRGWIVQALG